MNLELIKSEYKAHLFTERGKKETKEAIALMKEWGQIKARTHWTCSTANVRPKKIDKEVKKNIKKIKITPVGLNNMCHLNATLFNKKCGLGIQLGYNLTCCPCGGLMSYEIHSINKVGDELEDFTRDFNGEMEKWFYPIPFNHPYSAFSLIFGREYDFIKIKNDCKCNVRIVETEEVRAMTNKEFNEFIEKLRDMDDKLVFF